MKIERTMRGGEFRNILQKKVLMIWNEVCKDIKDRKPIEVTDKQLKNYLYEDGLDMT